MSNEKPVELTEAEQRALFSAFTEDSITALRDVIETAKADAWAAARREALLEAAESVEMLEQQRNEANDRADVAEAKVGRVEALAHRARLGTVSASDITAALAEPERDEEGGR